MMLMLIGIQSRTDDGLLRKRKLTMSLLYPFFDDLLEASRDFRKRFFDLDRFLVLQLLVLVPILMNDIAVLFLVPNIAMMFIFTLGSPLWWKGQGRLSSHWRLFTISQLFPSG